MIRCALASRWRGGCRPSFPLQAAPPSEQGFDRDRPVPNLGRRPISPCFARLVESKTPARWAAVCKAFAPRLLGSQTRVAAIANNSFIPYFIPIHMFSMLIFTNFCSANVYRAPPRVPLGPVPPRGAVLPAKRRQHPSPQIRCLLRPPGNPGRGSQVLLLKLLCNI